MRIAWAIPCREIIPTGDGLLTLYGVQVDGLVVERLPVAVQFDVAVRLLGPEHDFREHHEVAATLSGPDLAHVDTLVRTT